MFSPDLVRMHVLFPALNTLTSFLGRRSNHSSLCNDPGFIHGKTLGEAEDYWILDSSLLRSLAISNVHISFSYPNILTLEISVDSFEIFFFWITETVLKDLHITAFNPHNMSMIYLLSVSFCRKINQIFIQVSIPVSGKGDPRSPNDQLIKGRAKHKTQVPDLVMPL